MTTYYLKFNNKGELDVAWYYKPNLWVRSSAAILFDSDE